MRYLYLIILVLLPWNFVSAQPNPGNVGDTITVRWLNTGDDGSEGLADSLLMKFWNKPIDTLNFDSAWSLTNIPPPDSSGVWQSVGVIGLDWATEYWFGIITMDEAGNKGGLAVASATTRLAPDTIPPGTVTIELIIGQNFPNPFTYGTVIPFSLPEESIISLDVVNVSGRKVETIIEGRRAKGHHEIIWEPSFRQWYILRQTYS